MPVPPLTHHDIIRRAAALTRNGLKVNLANCDRGDRYIEFAAQSQNDESIIVVYALEVDEDNKQQLSRVVIHRSGLVSVLSAVTDKLEEAFNTFNQIPLSRQISIKDNFIEARSYQLAPDFRSGIELAVLQIRYVCANVAGIQLRVDASTGGGMPADAWLLPQGAASHYLRDTLADGQYSTSPSCRTATSLHGACCSGKQGFTQYS